MVLDSMNHTKGPGLKYANAGGIDFTLSRERSDLMTSWYALDEFFFHLVSYVTEMSDILLQQEGCMSMTGSIMLIVLKRI